MDRDDLTVKALALPPVRRAGLIEELLASFDPEARAAFDSAWAAEAEGRLQACQAGELDAVPLDEVRKRINTA